MIVGGLIVLAFLVGCVVGGLVHRHCFRPVHPLEPLLRCRTAISSSAQSWLRIYAKEHPYWITVQGRHDEREFARWANDNLPLIDFIRETGGGPWPDKCHGYVVVPLSQADPEDGFLMGFRAERSRMVALGHFGHRVVDPNPVEVTF